MVISLDSSHKFVIVPNLSRHKTTLFQPRSIQRNCESWRIYLSSSLSPRHLSILGRLICLTWHSFSAASNSLAGPFRPLGRSLSLSTCCGCHWFLITGLMSGSWPARERDFDCPEAPPIRVSGHTFPQARFPRDHDAPYTACTTCDHVQSTLYSASCFKQVI